MHLHCLHFGPQGINAKQRHMKKCEALQISEEICNKATARKYHQCIGFM